MATPRESFDGYVAAWNERDAARRARLLDECLADDFRLVTSGTVLRGREGLDGAIAAFQARRPGARAAMAGPLEVQGRLFRVTGVVEEDGQPPAWAFDAGEVDEAGRVRTILTFVVEQAPGT